MKIKKQLFRQRRIYSALLILLVVFATVLLAVLSNGGYFISLFSGTGLSSLISGGNWTVQQTISSDITSTKLTGGGYEISGNTNSIDGIKLKTDLTSAHCYPNPFKPSLGHTKITFANLTSHTKVRVFNIAGKFVYKNEVDTPNGELEWNAVDNDGDSLSSGVYIFIITDRVGSPDANNENHEKRGKIAIIR
ncbi:MAG: T9SS type A sorting domain-containing protein [Elusimicrobiota bacterium]